MSDQYTGAEIVCRALINEGVDVVLKSPHIILARGWNSILI